MSYFRELPNFEYIANFPNQSFNTDYVVTKNIFKRAKLRSDIANATTAFEYYQIVDNERPDQVAAKVYDNADLDWVILITNNITNINQQWPLDNNSFYKYLLDKYGSDQKISAVHHYETIEVRDEYNRLIVPGGYQVDSGKVVSSTTSQDKNDYTLSEFPDPNSTTNITINLNQYIPVYSRIEILKVLITDIKKDYSNFNIITRDSQISIEVENTLTTWPTSWGGFFKVKGRDGDMEVQVNDIILDNDITLDPLLYEIVGEELDGQIVPTFKFKSQI